MNNKNIQSVIKKFLFSALVVSALFSVSLTYADPGPIGFNIMGSDQEALTMLNYTQGETTQWRDPIPANAGDVVKLQASYHCGTNSTVIPTEQAQNTRIRVSAPTTSQNQVVTNVRIWADNATEKTETGIINASSAQTLIFKNTAKWYHNNTENEIAVLTGDGSYAEANLGTVSCDCVDCFDNDGFVIFTAKLSEPQNQPPTANAGPDKEVIENQTVVLNGSGFDPDGDPLTYSWSCTGGVLSNYQVAQPIYTAPTVTSDAAATCFLMVVDSKGASASDNVAITIRNQSPVNNSPVANAGSDKEVIENQTVVLNGSGSDPDGDPITYSWSCTNGTLSDYHVAQPTYTAPTVSGDSNYTCFLMVTDNKGASASDNMVVTVRDQNPSLSVDLTANPSSGNAPLNNVDLTADVFDGPSGTINYIFYCNRSDSGTDITSGWAYRMDGTNTDPLTASDICYYPSAGTYTAKVIVQRGSAVAEDRVTIYVSTGTVSTVDIKANGFDGPITIPCNASATLSWTSTNVTSCSASDGWSGTKSLSGSESTGSLTSRRVYVISCSGTAGIVSDSVTVNVAAEDGTACDQRQRLAIAKTVRNVTDNTGLAESVTVKALDKVEFSIRVTSTGSLTAQNVIVKDTLPAKITYQGNLKVDGVPLVGAGSILSGFALGNLNPGQSKTITFEATVDEESKFAYGTTRLINTAMAYNTAVAVSDPATVFVYRRAVAGAATDVDTGIVDQLIDYVLIPGLIAAVLIWVFRNYLLIIDKWLQRKKEEVFHYKAEKNLRQVISRIKAHEHFANN